MVELQSLCRDWQLVRVRYTRRLGEKLLVSNGTATGRRVYKKCTATYQRASIAARLMERGLEMRLFADRVDDLEDGLHLALCGAGGPLPAPKASGPCVAVVAGKRLFVVDVGTDSPRNLGRMRFQAGSVEAVFLTHFHSDHIDGLGELVTIRWAGGDNTQPLPVHGPEEVEQVVDGFNMSYGLDFIYRHEHHGDTVAPG